MDSWTLEHYLDVMDSFHVIMRIRNKDQCWGKLKFKGNCKACYVRCCCRDNLLWSMVLNLKVVIPPKYAQRKPALNKKNGRPTEKRVARLMEKEKELEVDARPFINALRVSAYSLLLSIYSLS